MRFYREFLRIPWTRRVNNWTLLRKLGTKRTFVLIIRKKQLKSIGHLIRKVCSEKLTLTGNVRLQAGTTRSDFPKEFVLMYDRRGSGIDTKYTNISKCYKV